jgi:hypothetical protein
MAGHALRMRTGHPFADGCFPSDQAAAISRSIVEGNAPVRYVCHHHDDSWAFTDAEGDPNEPGALLIVCVSHVTERDPSLLEMAALPPGSEALRDEPGEPWQQRAFDDE